MATQAAHTIDGLVGHNLFQVLFVYPLINVLAAIHNVLGSLHIPYALGFAIIILVLILRKLSDPLYKSQMENSKKMQEIQPELKKLQTEYKDNKEELSKKTMELYKEKNINILAGCLPALIQIPIFLALYQAISIFFTVDVNGKLLTNINSVLYSKLIYFNTIDPHFFGINLGLAPSNFGYISPFILVPILTGYLTYVQFTQSMPKAQPTSPSENQDDMQQAMNTQMKFMMPAMIGYFAYSFPLGLSLYWNITTIYSIVQYIQMNKKTH